MALNVRQQRFVEEYLTDLNATQAAIRAGYSERTAYSQGQRLLKHVEVQEAIQKAQEKRSERTQVSQDRVLKELSLLAFSNIAEVFDGGVLVPPDQLPEEVARFVSSFEIKERVVLGEKEEGGKGLIDRTYKCKTWDKLKALDMLCRHLGLYKEDNEQGARSLQEILAEKYGK